MQINASNTTESLGLAHYTGRDAEAELFDTQVRGVHVLETIEQSDELRDRLVQVLCPNCGEGSQAVRRRAFIVLVIVQVANYETGLRSAVDTTYIEMITTSEFAERVQS